MPAWLSYLLAAIICAVLAWAIPPVLPGPVDHVAAVLLWLGFVLCLVLALVALLRGRAPL